MLYNLYKSDKLTKNVKDRCCDFPLLEKNVENIIRKMFGSDINVKDR